MKIRTFPKTEYKSHPVYVRSWIGHAEYLTIIKDEIWTAHIKVRPDWWNTVLYWLGRQEWPYSQAQSDEMYAYMVKMAEATIDNFYFNK